jgi:hypothetical protein
MLQRPMVSRPRLRCVVLVAVLGLAVPGAAQATTLALEDGTIGPQPYQGWVDAARVPTVARTVTLRLDGCRESELLACAPGGDGMIDVAPEWMSRHVLFHELGHLFDDGAMSPGTREAFKALVHRGGPWDGPAETNPPNEQFAEAYALCARRRRLRRTYFAGYHYAPTPDMHRRVCGFIRQTAAGV